MPIPSVITDLSPTAGSNSPQDTDDLTTGDDFLRAHAAFIRQNYDAVAALDTSLRANLADGSNAALGDLLLATKRTETGGVATTQHALNQLRPAFPADFGAVGNGVADDTTALQALLAASLVVDFAGKSYKVSGKLQLRSGHVLIGSGATITQTGTRVEIFNHDACNGVRISGFNLVGVGTDFNNSDSSFARGTVGTGGSNVWVFGNKFTNFSCSAAHAIGVTGWYCFDNTIIGPGTGVLTASTSGANYGAIADQACTGIIISGNIISETAQGIVLGDGVIDATITGNQIKDIRGQHGMYCGGKLTNVSITGNTVRNVVLMGIKVQQYDTPAGDTRGVAISGNTVNGTGASGIQVVSSTGSPTYKLIGVSITGNTVYNATEDGFNLSAIVGGTVSGNTIRLCAREGISHSGCSTLSITNNTLEATAKHGIRDVSASYFVRIAGNTITDCCTAATVANRFGVLVQGGAEYFIADNVVTDANSKMEYGLYISGGTTTTMSVIDNVVTGATGTGARFPAATVLRQYKGNNFAGASGPVTTDPVSPSVASAAALTLPQESDVITVTGTTSITSILVNGHTGRRVTLIFPSSLTVTDGSNLLLAGNFVTTSNDTITLSCDGSNWYEVARSAN